MLIFIKMKFWIFRNYWWVFLILIMAFISPAIIFKQDLKVVLMLLGTLLSFFYFLQKQRLEEMKLFREIFSSCNDQYDGLNEKLGLILASNNTELTPEETQTLIDYFNLCGEEYLYFSQGYILPVVWDAWYKGMCWYLKDERISQLWEKEKETESYYGLKFDL